MHGGKREIRAGSSWGILKERDILEDLAVDGGDVVRVHLKYDSAVCTVFIVRRTGRSGGLFGTRH
jgi:hypothetical protein